MNITYKGKQILFEANPNCNITPDTIKSLQSVKTPLQEKDGHKLYKAEGMYFLLIGEKMYNQKETDLKQLNFKPNTLLGEGMAAMLFLAAVGSASSKKFKQFGDSLQYNESSLNPKTIKVIAQYLNYGDCEMVEIVDIFKGSTMKTK